jgi:DNA repair protein RadD
MQSLLPPPESPAITLRPYQAEAVSAVYDHLRHRDDHPCVVLPTACHGEGHPILMFDGTVKPIEEVAVGDLVMGPDSRPRRVMSLCRGEDDLYRIVPVKGESFVVNGGHVLSLVCTNEGKRDFACYRRGGEIDNIPVRDYLAKSKAWRHLRKLRRVPVEFNSRPDLPIPPYILGLLLGDGSLTDQTVALTTADEEIADAWIDYAHSINCGITVHASGGRCPSYRIVKNNGRYNVLTEALSALGLMGNGAGAKFVPHPYLVATRQERLALLAGLLDSDGHSNKSGCDYVTKSRELATDLMFLARSLGFSAHCTQKYCSCQTGSGGWFFRVSVWGDFAEVPCRLSRRKPAPRKQKKSVLRTGFRVEPCGWGRYFGFLLDGDHLYVDGHFIVHHNSGKTPVMASICRDAVGKWGGRVLILAHVKELLEQAVEKLHVMAPDLWNRIGVYSAGLKSRDTDHPIIVAGIQSVYKRAAELDAFDLICIDEAHMLPPDGEGMYRTFLADARVVNPNIRLVGLTATPYRMSTGMICGPENLLNHVCYEVGVRELIVQGYLCPLKTKAGRRKADTSNLHIRGGEFIAGEVEALMDDDLLVRSACREIVDHTQDRNSVLIFASGVKHALHVQRVLGEMGFECGFVCGETLPFERAQTLKQFQDGRLKYLVNVNVLTTGFDAPNIDCVVLLRPTNSPGLFYQMTGRGFRLHPGKTDCLVLDFGGNILRHGPVDALQVRDCAAGDGEAPAKECPECQAVIHAAYAACPECGYEFPPPDRQRHDRQAATAGILSGEVTETEYEVSDVYYSVHVKRGAPADHPRTMRVDYTCGFNDYHSEWVCPEHTGYARDKFEAWWRARSNEPLPDTVEEAVDICDAGGIAPTSAITVRSVAGEKFDRITDYQLGPIPPRLDGRDEQIDGDLPEPVWPEDEIPF